MLKEYTFTVDFIEGVFESDRTLEFVQGDNNTHKFIFNFENEIEDGTNVLLKMYTDQLYEVAVMVQNQTAEYILPNTILNTGDKMKISLTYVGNNNEVLTNNVIKKGIRIRQGLGDVEITPTEVSIVVSLVSQVNAIATAIESAEASRVIAENVRVSAETNRQTAEAGRVLAENARVIAEQQRQQDIVAIQAEQIIQNRNIEINATSIATNASNIASLQTNKANISDLPTKTSDLTNDSGFITKDVNNLTYYTDTNTMNTALGLKQNITDNLLQTNNKTIPNAINEINSIAKGANQALSYGNYQTMITAFNALASDTYNVGQNVMVVTLEVPDLWISGKESTSSTYTYVDDATVVNALATNGYIQVGYYKLSMLETQKVDLTGYYQKPASGIPKIDLASDVQTSLGKADTALQSYTEQYTGTITGITMNGVSKGTSGVVDLGTVITAHQDISGKENTSNKVTSISASSTNTQYPSAKAVYDYIASLDVEEVAY